MKNDKEIAFKDFLDHVLDGETVYEDQRKIDLASFDETPQEIRAFIIATILNLSSMLANIAMVKITKWHNWIEFKVAQHEAK